MVTTARVTVIKFRDLKWQRFKQVWDACQIAQVEVPKEVQDFFNRTPWPHDSPVEIDLRDVAGDVAVKKEEGNNHFICEVDLTKVDKDIHTLRVCIDWHPETL